jgi:hypothetical protein
MSNPKDNLMKESLKKLFNIESSILWSRGKTTATLSKVEQNRFGLLGTISGEIFQNRVLINQTSDDIFRERYNFYRSLEVQNQKLSSYRDILIAESRIDVLEHRHKLNKSMLDIGLMMASINRQLREVSESLLEANESLNEFNMKNFEKNKKFNDNHSISTDISDQEITDLQIKNLKRLEKLTEETENFKNLINETVLAEEKIKKDQIDLCKASETCSSKIEELRQNMLVYYEKLNK